MAVLGEKLREFVEFAQGLKGDEKSEAQTYIDRLLKAFGHAGAIEAGGTYERRIKGERTTMFADYELPGKVLIEMKKRGANLADHYQQAFNYWLELVPNRPAYVLLCNFDEIWVYDLNRQLRTPLQKVPLARLDEKEQFQALRFLEAAPTPLKPAFSDDHVAVTKEAADLVSEVYNSLIGTKKADRKELIGLETAQRYVLQCVVALYSEDAGLLPEKLFERLLHEDDILKESYDVLGGLFRQMNDPRPAKGGRFKEVGYFNGGLFSRVEPVELTFTELLALRRASKAFDWDMVEPEIFGTLFQKSMGKEVRHAYGAHYTNPIDIMKVVNPTIVRPWDDAIEAAKGYEALYSLRQSLSRYKVLDPACGSGNFLYIAYRELKAVERRLLRKMLDADRKRTLAGLEDVPFVSTTQFFGLDVLPFAVELAKVTLMLAKELAIMRPEGDDPEVADLIKHIDAPLPLDNLDKNVLLSDALLEPWPEADAIIGNPPYQAKNKLVNEIGGEKLAAIRARFPDVPGRADFCVYFFRRAHDELKPGGRAGLVGTNTIRQNDSRVGGLDYIVENGGVILDAVSTQPWSGDAAVHVSIVNWAKLPEALLPLDGKPSGGTQTSDGQMGFSLAAEIPLTDAELHAEKRLSWVEGSKTSGTEDKRRPAFIGPSLSVGLDVSSAKRLEANARSKSCYQGQTQGQIGFLITPTQAAEIRQDLTSTSVVHPFLIMDDLLGQPGGKPSRYAIDLNESLDSIAASKHKKAFAYVKSSVMPSVLKNADKELVDTGKKGGPRQNHAEQWWRFWRGRPELMNRLATIPRYIATGQVIKRPVFEFVSSDIHPNAQIIAFPLADDYSFGILQSGIHWAWFIARCSTLTERFRYTSDTVFDSFSWPQSPTPKQIRDVADAAVALRSLRKERMKENGWTYRTLYRSLETPGKNALRDAQDALDRTVRAAYGMPPDADPLAFLLDLNRSLAAKESAGEVVIPPGLPTWIEDRDAYITDDCIRPDPLD